MPGNGPTHGQALVQGDPTRFLQDPADNLNERRGKPREDPSTSDSVSSRMTPRDSACGRNHGPSGLESVKRGLSDGGGPAWEEGKGRSAEPQTRTLDAGQAGRTAGGRTARGRALLPTLLGDAAHRRQQGGAGAVSAAIAAITHNWKPPEYPLECNRIFRAALHPKGELRHAGKQTTGSRSNARTDSVKDTSRHFLIRKPET